MARPEKGLREWQIKKLAELNITSWKDADDALAKMKEGMQAKAKAKEADMKKSGFGAMDAKADDKKTETKSDVAKAETSSIVLPATQTVDVTAPTINVHVPAPGVTIMGEQFKFYPFVQSVFSWVQAAVIGASIYAAVSSRLTVLAYTTLSP